MRGQNQANSPVNDLIDQRREFKRIDDDMKMGRSFLYQKIVTFPVFGFWLTTVMALLFSILSAGTIFAAQNVLVLNSYHKGYLWSDNIIDGIEKKILKKDQAPLLHIEYLNTKRNPAGLKDPSTVQLLKQRYRGIDFDVVITCDDNATWFFLEHRDELLPGVPLVFCGVNGLDPQRLNGIQDVTGVNEDADIEETLTLMLRLHPKTRKILAITDITETGTNVARDFKRCQSLFSDQVKIELVDHISMDELERKIAGLEPGSLIIYSFFFIDSTGKTFEFNESAAQVAAAAKVPVYTTWSFNNGFGMVGGKQINGFSQGQAAAAIAEEILSGKKAGELPIQFESPNNWIFSYPVLQKYFISQSDLPDGSIILEKPDSVYQKYKGTIWAIIGLVIFQGMIIAILIETIKRRRQEIAMREEVEKALRRSEEKLQTLFSSMTEILILCELIFDEKGSPSNYRILDANEALFKATGFSREAVIGKLATEVLATEDAPYLEIFAKVAISRQPQKFETYFQLLNRHLNISVVSPLANQFATVVNDVTSQKLTQEKYEIFARALENSTDAVGMSTAAGFHYYQNKAFSDLFGNIGTSPKDTLYVDRKVGEEVFQAIMAGNDWAGEVQMYGGQGQILDILLRAYASKDKDGRIISLVGLHTDITERKLLEERIRQSQKMDAFGQLAGGIAHDFNNQLNGIRSTAELLLPKLESQNLKEYVQHILTAVTRSAGITQQLLAFARKGQFNSVPADIHRLVGEVVQILNHSIDKKIEICQEFAIESATTRGDPSQLQNALLNLALNARDAMPTGGKITFRTEIATLDEEYCAALPYEIQPGDYIRISVKDTGCGIPSENIKRIFEPFFTTKETGKGTGIGLSAVYGTVKQHNGAIDVVSQEGRGTTVNVFLPVELKEVEKPIAKASLRAADRPANILLVDDEELIQLSVGELLTNLGYSVTSKLDGQAAIEYFAENWQKVDLVVLDMVMPKMNGSEVFEAMKKINPMVKVLISSGFSFKGEVQDILDKGAQGYIQKPFILEDFAGKIAEVLVENRE
ncbi:MAG: ABC transporter substrate binding protein [Candidatus Rifleibacteriota bacterium]